MQLAYHESGRRRRQNALTREEEVRIATMSGRDIMGEIYHRLVALSQMKAEQYRSHPDYVLLNSLIWVYVQVEPERVRKNIQILMAWAGVPTINKLAKASGMNASFVARMLKMEDAVDFGGWNFDNVLRLSHALGRVRPELMLESDLASAVNEHVTNWQLP